MMQKPITFFLAVLLWWLGCARSTPPAQEEQRLRQLIDQYSAAFDHKDFVKFAGFCTEDMLFYTLDGQVFDRDAMVKFLNRILDHWQELKTTIQHLQIAVDSKLAWARYNWSLAYIAGGQPGIMHNLVTVTFRKTDSGWRIAHFHMSTSYK